MTPRRLPPRPATAGTARAGATAVVVAGLLVGCAADGPIPGATDARDTWAQHGPTSYAYTLTAGCGERALTGTYRVTVTDGEVSAVEPLDKTAEWSLPAAAEHVPTVSELLDRIVALPAQQVPDVAFAEDGVPTVVFLDNDPTAIDDEECYEISDVRPAG